MDFLNNTEIVVAIGFVIFVGVLIYFGVPGMLTRALDARAVRIKAELDEARALRDEAQTLLAGYERRQKEVKAQAEDIVTAARAEAEKAAEAAKEDIRKSVARRLKTAAEQIAAAEQSAIRQIKDRAVTVAVAAAGDVLRENMKAADANRLIDAAISEVGDKLH
jgi:F-type H+-transporting ATPase subunit b